MYNDFVYIHAEYGRTIFDVPVLKLEIPLNAFDQTLRQSYATLASDYFGYEKTFGFYITFGKNNYDDAWNEVADDTPITSTIKSSSLSFLNTNRWFDLLVYKRKKFNKTPVYADFELVFEKKNIRQITNTYLKLDTKYEHWLFCNSNVSGHTAVIFVTNSDK